MRFSTIPLVFALLLLFQSLTGCSSPASNSNAANVDASNSQKDSQAGVKDNIEEFAMLVRLPFDPEEVAWKEKPDQKLVAVIRFSPENAAKMAADAAKNGQPSAETLTVESWFPAELLAQGEMTGESTVKGQSYPADPFLNPPYTKGRITRVEDTDYFILQISS